MLAAMAGAVVGLWLTYLAVEYPPNFGTLQIGAWIVRPHVGTANADPYTRAMLAMRGEIPMSAAEGLMLTATQDSSGKRLKRNCTYTITGVMPPANYWTLTAYRQDGLPRVSTTRSSYTSAEALMAEDGHVVITLSPQPQSGNWIPMIGNDPFTLYLRLYDTQVSSSGSALDRSMVPVIRREHCP